MKEQQQQHNNDADNRNNTYKTDDSNLVRNSIVSGSIAGIASTVVMFPMDVLRTKMQGTVGVHGNIQNVHPPPPAGKSHCCGGGGGGGGVWQVARQTLQHGGGVRALYTGMTLPLAGQALYKATVFTVNNITERCILERKQQTQIKTTAGRVRLPPPELSLADRFVSGFFGGAVNAAIFVTPIELIRNQLIMAQHTRQQQRAAAVAATAAVATATIRQSPRPQHQPHNNCASATSAWQVIRNVIQQQQQRNHGSGGSSSITLRRIISTLWRGVHWSMARDGLGCGCFFVAMAWTQQKLVLLQKDQQHHHNHQQRQQLPPLTIPLLSGGMAGLAYWIVALPLDTAKTWVQSSDLRIGNCNEASSSSSSVGAVVSPLRTVQQLYRTEGLGAVVQRLFAGWQVAYGRGLPSAAITISVYSVVYQYLQRHY